jgi:hypothetical protein
VISGKLINRKGGSILEFLLSASIIGTLLSVVFILTVEFIDRKQIEYVLFKSLRESILISNSEWKKKIDAERLKEKILKELNIKYSKIIIRVLENNGNRVKLQLFCMKKNLIPYTYKQEITLNR